MNSEWNRSLRSRLEQRVRRTVGRVATLAEFLPLWAGVHATENTGRLSRLRGKHTGETVFVIGNGPSLTLDDLDAIQGRVSIASNGIFLVFDRTKYRPTYYTVEDTLVAEDRAPAIQRLTGFTRLFPRDVATHVGPAGDSTLFLNFVRSYRGFPRFSPDLSRAAYWGGTVTFLNLQLAYYLGASKIILLGVDHNYSAPAPADRVQGAVITSQTADRNHFDPAYFGPGYRWHDPQTDRMESAYRAARQFLEARNVAVLNATRGGKLEVFERVDLSEVVRENRS